MAADVTADIDWKMLRDKAIEVAAHAYAPYSGFPVGAAALVDDGRMVAGCNVENVSYGLGLCAECAVVCALHSGGGGRLIALSCVDGAGDLLMPCGRCRQVLLEHGGPDMLIDHPHGPAAAGRAAARRVRARRSGPSGARDTGKAVTQFAFDAPTVIRTKRDGGRLSDAADRLGDRRLHPRPGRRRADVGAADGDLPAGHGPRRDRPLDRGDGRLRRAAGLLRSAPRRPEPLALVDKHSTGGVGDKITIPLVPVVVACGGAVPQAAGPRARATPAARWTSSSPSRASPPRSPRAIRQQLCDVGAAIFAAGELAPADRKIYALRDVTAHRRVAAADRQLDDEQEARRGRRRAGARRQGRLGGVPEDARPSPASWPAPWSSWATPTACPTRALLTDMDAPLGRAVGNAVEVAESLEVLAGGGPRRRRRADAGAGPRDARAGRRRRCRPGRHAARRHRDGPVPRAGRRAGRRPRRNRCRSVRIRRPSWHLAAARWATSTRWRWDWRCGGSVRAARFPVSACSPAPACASTGGPASPSPRASRCSRCTPTPRSGSRAALAELDGALERRGHAAGRPPADHRSDRIMTALALPLTLDSIRHAPKALLHDHLDGGLRPATVLDIAAQIGYDGPARHRRRRAGDVVPHRRAQRVAGALPGAVRAHRRR